MKSWIISIATNLFSPAFDLAVYLKCYIASAFLFLTCHHVFGQNTAAIEHTDTIVVEKKVRQKGQFKAKWKLPYPNPYRAGIYSLAFPGAGQIYNKRYWKAPIVWGGFAALVYVADYNRDLRDRFKTAFGQRQAGEEDEFVNVIRDAETLRRLRNSAEKNLQTTYIGFVALYALNALDAYVDAHLKNFDIGDDLTLTVGPSKNSIGLAIALRPGD